MKFAIQIQPQTLRARVRASLLLCAITVVLLAIAAKDPRTYGVGILCPSLRIFGIYCPGCGSTRATYFLLHGEVETAFRHNPLLLLLGVPILGWMRFALALSAARAKKPILSSPAWIGWVVVVLLIGYCVFRNIPLASLEHLRPPSTVLPLSVK